MKNPAGELPQELLAYSRRFPDVDPYRGTQYGNEIFHGSIFHHYSIVTDVTGLPPAPPAYRVLRAEKHFQQLEKSSRFAPELLCTWLRPNEPGPGDGLTLCYGMKGDGGWESILIPHDELGCFLEQLDYIRLARTLRGKRREAFRTLLRERAELAPSS
jgi:hypothetical protein